jgi:RNA polymerase sigma-70 factor (ECF subfamily)
VSAEATILATTKARPNVSSETRVAAVPKPCSFEEVYAQHARFVFRVLRGMGVPDAQVDDALQDVFIVVHQRLPEFDPRARVTTWLFQIALRVAYGYRRKGRRAHEHTPFEDEQAASERSPSEHAEANEDARQMQALLDGLDEEKRAVLILAELGDLSAPEIAMLTGTPLNTVYTRLRRARASLVSLWRKRGGQP